MPPELRLSQPHDLKVLFISRSYPPVLGGMETLSYHLTTGIKCKKKIIALGLWNRIHIIWFLPFAFFYALLNSKKFDVIHFSDGLTAILGIPLKFLFKKNIFVSNIHGLDINFQNKKGRLSKVYGIYIRILTKKQPHLWIANSKNTRDMALALGLKNVRIIYPGINPEEFHYPSPSGGLAGILGEKYNNKNIYILTLGRLTRRKGQKWFIENVLPELPPRVHYIVAGKSYILEGKDESEILRKTVKKTGLQHRVTFIDTPSDNTRLKLLSASHLFVMPNLPVKGDVEGFGIVAIEAAASGTPVVASALEGIKDAVNEGVTGHLVKSGDINGFINKIKDLISDINSLDRQGVTAREYVKKNFGWQEINRKYLQSFTGLKQNC